MNRYLVYQLPHGNIIVAGEHQSRMDRLHQANRHRRCSYVYARTTPPDPDHYRITNLMGFPAWIFDQRNH